MGRRKTTLDEECWDNLEAIGNGDFVLDEIVEYDLDGIWTPARVTDVRFQKSMDLVTLELPERDVRGKKRNKRLRTIGVHSPLVRRQK